MMETKAYEQEVKSIELEAEVIRADGTVETLGVVSAWYDDPKKMAKARAQGIGEVTLCE